MAEILKQISNMGLVPVVVLEDAEKAVPVAKALQRGGIDCAEVTFRTAAAEEYYGGMSGNACRCRNRAFCGTGKECGSSRCKIYRHTGV